MLKIENDKTINLTRGDSGTITISAKTNTGETYEFQTGDVLRFKVMSKSNVENVVLEKDIEIKENCTIVDINLNSKETRIGEYINKPVTYWYEVELNPDGNSVTIIGYDEEGAKKLKLYPEGKNLEEGGE